MKRTIQVSVLAAMCALTTSCALLGRNLEGAAEQRQELAQRAHAEANRIADDTGKMVEFQMRLATEIRIRKIVEENRGSDFQTFGRETVRAVSDLQSEADSLATIPETIRLLGDVHLTLSAMADGEASIATDFSQVQSDPRFRASLRAVIEEAAEAAAQGGTTLPVDWWPQSIPRTETEVR